MEMAYWPNRTVLARLKGKNDEPYAILVKNGSVNLEPWPVGLDSKSLTLPRLPRSNSMPEIGEPRSQALRWGKPWNEQSGEMLKLHLGKKCLPCFFYHHKADGCRRGADCDRCHICTLPEMKKRKLRLHKAHMRAAPRSATAS
ncbi:unnamed protein product [Effrenium voratum]|uniref:C3H1-type domain-containing protein n=1 Tax=Effrenium voratum TaxID=2562239 RepID=A0AA36JJ16_9DINO|nr:unnamed protein product [Effrenium voratum]